MVYTRRTATSKLDPELKHVWERGNEESRDFKTTSAEMSEDVEEFLRWRQERLQSRKEFEMSQGVGDEAVSDDPIVTKLANDIIKNERRGKDMPHRRDNVRELFCAPTDKTDSTQKSTHIWDSLFTNEMSKRNPAYCKQKYEEKRFLEDKVRYKHTMRA
ncbi:unnamed protein product [Vitrella brassicaformis CCMP3155]|uniref:Uncharacterized protein n=1 Tax=Vitrella brassicaformis (strain CCMP3155) TaxID=1169540 RepID=A0A0G4G3P3_VITBC|nr:unnamed protein product [Vitrella brassicaformis CCMP3155]|eukprot:CEM22680.1 unnamed protein product [Vitrella brassicaformis CCMP3155]